MAEFGDLLAVIRDVIVIVTFLTLLVLLVGLFALYRKLSGLLDSAKSVAASTEQIADAISSRIVGPAAAGSGLAFGMGKAAAFFRGFRKKKSNEGGGEKDGE